VFSTGIGELIVAIIICQSDGGACDEESESIYILFAHYSLLKYVQCQCLGRFAKYLICKYQSFEARKRKNKSRGHRSERKGSTMDAMQEKKNRQRERHSFIFYHQAVSAFQRRVSRPAHSVCVCVFLSCAQHTKHEGRKKDGTRQS
jgi:hypothetical protein